jgi:hypothetical protein
MRPTVATINFTNRQRIEREYVRIVGGGDATGGYFSIEKLELSEFVFDSLCEIVVECWTSKYGYHRFEVGSISKLDKSTQYPFRFSELANAKLNIRIVSVEEKTKGMVVGEAHGLSVEIGGKPPSLLPIDQTQLDQRVWNLLLDFDSGPVLQMNERLSDYQQVAKDDVFRAISMVTVIEKIGEWVLKKINAGEQDEYVKKWTRAFTALGHNPEEVNSVNVSEVADFPGKVGKAFARKNSFYERFVVAVERSIP